MPWMDLDDDARARMREHDRATGLRTLVGWAECQSLGLACAVDLFGNVTLARRSSWAERRAGEYGGAPWVRLR